MWPIKTYTVACHGCGRVHDVQAHFLSTPMSVQLPDGREVGVMGCADCLKVPGKIRAAYERIQSGGRVIPQAETART